MGACVNIHHAQLVHVAHHVERVRHLRDATAKVLPVPVLFWSKGWAFGCFLRGAFFGRVGARA